VSWAKANAKRKGTHLSAETRAKISAALKGRHHKGHKWTSAQRAKMRAHHRHMSAENKAKLSARMKAAAAARKISGKKLQRNYRQDSKPVQQKEKPLALSVNR
jgi:Tfp pilus assembly major pilin PilA